MKQIITLLFIVSTISISYGQNLLDSAIVGYENASSNYKKAFVNDIWYGNFSDSAFYRTDEQVFAGNASLAFDVDVFETLTADKKLYFNTDPFPSASGAALDAGSYIVSYQLYIDPVSTLNEIATKTESPAVLTKWDVSNTPKGEWIQMKKLIKYDSSIGGKKYHLQVLLSGNSGVTGAQKFYVDDHRFEAYTMDTIEGNYLDHYYYGFEAGTEDVSGIFIPSTSDAFVSFSDSVNANPVENFYALRYEVPANSTTDLSIQIGNKDALGQDGSLNLPAGDYVASIKVYLDERNITQFTSPIQDQTATVDNEYKTITWEIPEDIALREWVTLNQVVTIDYNTDTKMQIKVTPSNMIDASKGQVLYIDDLAFVDYTPSTQEEIYSFDGGINGGEGVWYTSPAGDFFSVTDEKALTGNYGLKYTCADVATLPTNETNTSKVQMGLGNAETDNSYLNLDAGNYDVKCKIWLEPGCDVKNIGLNIKQPWAASNFDLTSIAKGEWVELTNMVTLAEASVNSNFQIVIKEANYGVGTFYIDDITITKSTATGINKHLAKAVKIYPNPADNNVTIEAEEGIRIAIFSLAGKMMSTISNASAMTQISLGQFESGLYLVSIKTNEGETVKKLQVK